MAHNNIAVIGLSVMGSNLALNIADNGYKVAVYNRTTSVMEDMIKNNPHENIEGIAELKDLVASLVKPRKFIIMVKAGAPVDAVIDQLLEYVEEGDIIIDGGNSFFKDTQRRYDQLSEKNIHFFGVGISGGEEGARRGPAIMPGGNEQAYKEIQPILEAIAAKVNDIPCCSYTSTGGAGHYVKMVHNGIEYGDMQLISEAYKVLKHLGGFSNEELQTIFEKWNGEELESYLIEITANIFKVKDPEGHGYLVDKILDRSGQKGTGKWTTEQAVDLGIDISVISSSLDARYMSANKDERILAEKEYGRNPYKLVEDRENLIKIVKESLYAAKIISYAQGFKLLKAAATEYGWSFDYAQIAKIFRGGCIIQAKLLQNIIEAYQNNPSLDNLLLDPFFKDVIKKNQSSLRELVILAIQNSLPVTSMSSALTYLDILTTADSGANLIQAQRDYFGAHTFERTDKDGFFHYNWVGNNEK
ncbi:MULTISPECIES: decarboxylating NADP(+)-dependent phosphogluconate dehydrogenase [unclassified Gemella]|uniref:decarboxylating NADP(+)-dependent phosphogluconate dehydrogenase n=1 Tax=unclassified Gemella TaxID=2624949 RepID=UPI001073512E|nr:MULTISPECIES: decarboxylating NADP(+)-dependent phosphogluconate dehydrogenase [unclassified Gemella]MBF0709941.1 decarboxylating NADP(+)-dependent phosphogluconate dehydrogenase [Gemella sp. GL1.1]MBF0746755.1 decarboxylating NADP(+)-dependent phosphogluconate dehydrogenase [Gemella sp. 19428wG2_WT2a]NYS27285.1 decarboxylating NADP(+)-dependent phosphogluconate dehydrogenase [Gemella sp. GL1]TFU59480.1 decarboxylating NADP(+)-dependent phosphogluconate dehydrogenase [Gemella sp. WT2a]